MPTIMADHDVEGHLQVLIKIWSSTEWNDLWVALSCGIENFQRLGLSPSSPDEEVWRVCQERQITLITGNRNAEGDDSLEITIRREGTSDSLPV